MRTSNRPLYPVFVDLAGCPVLLVGGGEVARRKAAALLECGARLAVVAPEIDSELAALLKKQPGRTRVLRRKFRAGDLAGFGRKPWRLVFAASNDAALNARIAAACRKRCIWVNAAAPPEAGDVQVPAALRRGPVCVAFSTGGASAALARTLRERLEKQLGPEWGELAALLSARRESIQRALPDPASRAAALKKFGSLRWLKLVRKHGHGRAAKLIDREIETWHER